MEALKSIEIKDGIVMYIVDHEKLGGKLTTDVAVRGQTYSRFLLLI